MATGLVQFVGTQIFSGQFAGDPPTSAIDGDFNTLWANDVANGGWLGLDLGAAGTVSSVLLASGADPNNDVRWIGAKVQSSTASDFSASLTTYTTLANPPFISPLRYSSVAVPSGLSHRYWRMLGADGNYGGSWAELRFLGSPAIATTYQPCKPVISPWGGPTTTGSIMVTMTCPTTSASIFYTIDGSTPTVLSTPYTAPFSLTVGGVVTVKAIAFDATCTTTLSEVANPAIFRNYVFKPNDTLYSVNNGNNLDAHNVSIVEYPVGSGTFIAVACSSFIFGNDQIGENGVWLYSTTDLINFTALGNIIPVPSGWSYAIRPSLLVDASGNLSIWVHVYNIPAGTSDRARVYSCASGLDPSIPANWVDHGDLNPNGIGFKDSTRVLFGGVGYAIYTDGNQTASIMTTLSPNLLTTTGSVMGTDYIIMPGPAAGGSGEGYAAVVYNSGSKLGIAFCDTAVYYDSSLDYKIKFIGTTNPMSAVAYGATSSFYATNPTGTNYNGQPCCFFTVPNKVNGYVMVGDYWAGYPGNMTLSNLVFTPMIVSGSNLQGQMPTTWDYSTFANSGGGGGGGTISRGNNTTNLLLLLS